MEIERAADCGVKMLLIHQKGTHISTMATTASGVVGGVKFGIADELSSPIAKFLAGDTSRAPGTLS